MDDGDDQVSKVMTVAGGARRGLVSSALNVENAPCRDNCSVKPDGYVITPDGRALGHPEPSRRRSQINDLLLSTSRHDRYVDDLSGLPLDPELCKAARRKELD